MTEAAEMRDIKEFLSNKYDIDINNITPVKNVLRVSTSYGEKCFKKVKYRKEDFLFILSAMKHLLDMGFKSIIPFISTKDGELFVELEDGFGFLTEWISGKECDYSNPIELRTAAYTLAKLHNASCGFEPTLGSNDRSCWGKWIDRFTCRLKDMLKFKEIIKSKSNHSYFDKLYLENTDYHIEQAMLAIEHLKATDYFELMQKEMKNKSFCHHDYAHHNVLLSNDFNVYIIDFDYCILDSRLHDLSSLIIRNMRHGNWNIEKAQYIIDCYLKYGHLEKDEIPVMSAFIEFPQDFWQVGLQYYIEKQKWEESNFNKRLNNVINDKRDKKEFIDEFMYLIKV